MDDSQKSTSGVLLAIVWGKTASSSPKLHILENSPSVLFPPFLMQLSDSQSQGDQLRGDSGAPLKHQPWRWQVEHLLFPTLRSDFVPPCSMATDGSVLQLADLHDLYKVFERC